MPVEFEISSKDSSKTVATTITERAKVKVRRLGVSAAMLRRVERFVGEHPHLSIEQVRELAETTRDFLETSPLKYISRRILRNKLNRTIRRLRKEQRRV